MAASRFEPDRDDPRRAFALTVVKKLRSAGFESLWAGGCVRDALMGLRPKDYDVATSAVPDEVISLFGRHRTIPVGASFGVVIVPGPTPAAGQVEVATFRSDGPYSDGRRPDSVEFCTPERDAARRDFTINGMFFDPVSERVVDYVGGGDDVKRRVIRAIGDPDARFDEDKLRMLRAVRFSATLDFRLDPDTERSIVKWHSSLSVVSVERVNAELHRMLAHASRAVAVDLLRRTRLLEVIFPAPAAAPHPHGAPEPGQFEQLLKTLRELQQDRFEPSLLLLLRTCGFTADDCDDRWLRHEAARLKLSNSERDCICWLHRGLPLIRSIADQPLHVIKPLLSHSDLPLLLDLAAATARAADESTDHVHFCREFVAQHSSDDLNPPPLISGHDVLQAGVPAGRRINTILSQVRREQLDEQLRDREAALARMRELAEGP